MNQRSNTGLDYDSIFTKRPLSEQGIDIHIYVVPLQLWRDHLRSADSQTVITDAISAGFIRVMPNAIVNSLRIDIENQLGFDSVPRNFVFLKCVGRCFTVIKAKQEYSIKAKNFIPPQTFAPEIFLMELTADIRSILTSSQSNQSLLKEGKSYRKRDSQEGRHYQKPNSHVTNPYLKPNESRDIEAPHLSDSRLSFSEKEEEEEDSEEEKHPVQVKRQLTVTKSTTAEIGDYVLTPNSKYTQTMAERETEVENAENRTRLKRREEEERRKEMLRRLALEQQREEQWKREEMARKEAETTKEEERRRKQEEELRRRLEEEHRRKKQEEEHEKRKQEEEHERRKQEEDHERRKQEEDHERRKQKEEHERRRLEEEHRSKREEEERKWLEKVKQRELEEQKKQKEELARRFEEEQRRRKEEEIRRVQDEELRKKQNEELKKKFVSQQKGITDEEFKSRQEEQLRRKLEEEIRRKQDEERQRRQEEELGRKLNEARRKQEEEHKRKQDELNRKKEEDERKRMPEEQQKATERAALLKEIERLREDRKMQELKKDELTKKVKNLQERSQLDQNAARGNWRKKYLEEKKKTPALNTDGNRLKKELDAINKKILSNVESTSHIINRGANQQPSVKSNLKIQAIRLRMEIEDLKARLDNMNMKLTAELKLRTQAEEELQLHRKNQFLRKKAKPHFIQQEKQKPNGGRGRGGGGTILGGKRFGSHGSLTPTQQLPPVA